MAKKISGIVIEIEGKTDGLAAALKKANERVNEVSSSLSKVDKALKLDPHNVELLAQKQSLLTEAIGATENKLDVLKKTAAEAEDALARGAITQGEYEQLQAEVSLTAAKLKTLANEADGTAKQIDELGNESAQADDKVEELGDDSKSSGEKAEKGGEGFQKFGAAVKKGAEIAAAALAAVVTATAATTKALVDCSVAGSQYADDILTLSTNTHVATEDLQAFKYAANLVDVEVSTITGALTKTTATMSSAASGSGAAAEAYKKLGVSVTDANGNLRSNQDVFYETIDALGKVENLTERDSLAMSVFGKSASELNPLIEKGSEAFKAYTKEAEEAGAIMSGSQLEAYGAFNDTLARLESGSEAAKNALGTILLPTLNELGTSGVDLLGEFSRGVIDADGDMGKISETISSVIKKAVDAVLSNMDSIIELASSILGSLASALMSNLDVILSAAGNIVLSIGRGIIENLPSLIQTALSVITELAVSLLAPDNIALLAQAAVDIVITLSESLAQSVSLLIPAVMTAVFTLIDTITDPENLTAILNSGLELLMSLTLGIIDAIPQLVGSIPVIIGRLVAALIMHTPELIKAGITLTIELTKGLVLAIPELLVGVGKMIWELLKAFGSFGSDLANQAMTWGVDLMKQLIAGIKSKISAVGEMAKNIAKTIASYIGFSLPDKGPLARTDTFMPDMIDVLTSGIRKGIPQLESSVGALSSVMAGALQPSPDYSGALAGISGQLSNLGGETVIPVYIGSEKLDTLILKSNQRAAFRSGR